MENEELLKREEYYEKRTEIINEILNKDFKNLKELNSINKKEKAIIEKNLFETEEEALSNHLIIINSYLHQEKTFLENQTSLSLAVYLDLLKRYKNSIDSLIRISKEEKVLKTEKNIKETLNNIDQDKVKEHLKKL